jgi:hypothetical protein
LKISLPRNVLAQIAHVGWGALLVLALHDHFWNLSLSSAVGAVIGFAALKEAVFDPLTEDTATQGSGWVDFAFWCVGAALAFVIASF